MFSNTTEYALRAMACLSLTPDVLTATPALAARTKVPINYLAKILQHLAAAGLITGRRGVGGGYRLKMPASDIRLYDVVRAVGSVDRAGESPAGADIETRGLRALHKKLEQASRAVVDILEGCTLADLAAEAEAASPDDDSEPAIRTAVRARQGGHASR